MCKRIFITIGNDLVRVLTWYAVPFAFILLFILKIKQG
jgi:hypothetical protein